MRTLESLGLKLKTPKQKEVYRRGLDRPDLEEPYKHLARLLAREGDAEGAEKVLKLALARFPKNRLMLEQLADLYQSAGKTARAVEIYRGLVKEKESWSAFVRLARIYKKKGDFPAAAALFKSIPPSHPFRPRAYQALQELYSTAGDHRSGAENMKQAIKHLGEDFRRLKALGRHYMKIGKKREAIRAFEKALTHQRGELDTIKLIGLAYLDLGEYTAARRYFNRILSLQPDSYQAQIQLAELSLLQGRLEEAKKWLDQIRRVQKKKGEPWDSRSKLATGEYLLKKGRFEEAIELVREGLGETPEYYPMEILQGHGILAAAYKEAGDEFRARVHELIQKALASDLDVFSSLTRLAKDLEKRKRTDEAKEVLEQLLLSFPGNVLALVNLAETQFRRGMTDSAVALARAAAGGEAGRFVKDKIQALKLLARLRRARKDEAGARECERRIAALGGKRSG